ncbi:hypothetical protein Q5P01_008642 [Channa striata]|uniref:Interleukin n=1 Tax=Channa striata TaxID=64152 RepID=A0AA88SU85_CHASR|nr:hypothetical protein Q5P01_008642 [Channa striata]
MHSFSGSIKDRVLHAAALQEHDGDNLIKRQCSYKKQSDSISGWPLCGEHIQAPRTRVLTTHSNHVVVTASGKENFITHNSFCSFPTQYKWFSCVPRDTYKKVCCWALVNAMTTNVPDKSNQKRKLEEVLRQLNEVKSLQHNEAMLSAPPENIEDCCCLSALQCFRANMQVHFNMAEKKQSKLYKSLKHRYTEKGLEFCNSGSRSTCQDCHSHPKVNVNEFFNRLESLIQRAIARLNME